VDDHPGILKRLPMLLEPGFEVAGSATSGRQALGLVDELAPDVIVLDVSMPDLTGFQTKRALDEAGSRIPVVFLSTSDEESDIEEAFRCGGRGYVVKPQAARDLPSAIEQVLSGRRFVPSLSALPATSEKGEHLVQIYSDTASYLDTLADCFSAALRRGDATCLIASADVHAGITRRLRVAGWDVGGTSEHRRFRVIEPEDGGDFVLEGKSDANRMERLIADLDQYRKDAGRGPEPRLMVFGLGTASRFEAGNVAATLATEALWTRLTRGLPWITICGYHASSFRDGDSVWSSVCETHSSVGHAAEL
jgi:CheY-like chemotaxis protein